VDSMSKILKNILRNWKATKIGSIRNRQREELK
jgi:hypothetical protein